MLTVAFTPVKAAAASAPCVVVDMAEMFAAGSLTTSGVSAVSGGGGTAMGGAPGGGTCNTRGTGALTKPCEVIAPFSSAVGRTRRRVLDCRKPDQEQTQHVVGSSRTATVGGGGCAAWTVLPASAAGGGGLPAVSAAALAAGGGGAVLDDGGGGVSGAGAGAGATTQPADTRRSVTNSELQGYSDRR